MKKSLKDAMLEAGYTEEEIKKFDEQFPEDDRQEKFAGGYLKNADYTAKTQQLAAEKKRLEEEADTYVQSLGTYKTDLEGRLSAAVAQTAKQKLYGAALEAKIQKLAVEYGEDFDELMKDVTDQRAGVKEPVKPAIDDEEFGKKYVSRDDFQKAGDHFFSYPVQMRDLEREYHRLYGKEYEGSLSELVKEASVQVNAQRARGNKDIDLFGYMRQKLDFEGQKARNVEAQKTKSAEDQKKWEEDKAKEIETRLRSELLAANPALSRPQPDSEAWRQNLTAAARKEAKHDEQPRSASDHLRRQQGIHRAYEERAAKTA